LNTGKNNVNSQNIRFFNQHVIPALVINAQQGQAVSFITHVYISCSVTYGYTLRQRRGDRELEHVVLIQEHYLTGELQKRHCRNKKC